MLQLKNHLYAVGFTNIPVYARLAGLEYINYVDAEFHWKFSQNSNDSMHGLLAHLHLAKSMARSTTATHLLGANRALVQNVTEMCFE